MSEKSEDGNTPNNIVDPILELKAILIKHRAEIHKEYNELRHGILNILVVLAINFLYISLMLNYKK